MTPIQAEALTHAVDRTLRAAYGRQSLSSDMEEPFRSSATLWGWITVGRSHIPFRFETIKGGINSPNRHFALNARLDLLPHRNPVGLIFQSQERKKNNVFEFAEVIASKHYFYNIKQMNALMPHEETKAVLRLTTGRLTPSDS